MNLGVESLNRVEFKTQRDYFGSPAEVEEGRGSDLHVLTVSGFGMQAA